MSFAEILHEVDRLSAEERKQLRQRLELREFLSDPDVVEEMRAGDRQIKEGRIFTREEVIAAVERAERETSGSQCRIAMP